MKIPTATYRLQFNHDFTFKQAINIIPYLKKLGVQTIYASPIFEAVPLSNHGYDVTNMLTINPEIGTLEELKELKFKLNECGMLWLQDIVPNHMAYHINNKWIKDIWLRGKQSAFSEYFDINFNHSFEPLKGKILAPFLGKTIEKCLAANEIKLEINPQGLFFNYFNNLFPVCDKSLFLILFQIKDNTEWFENIFHQLNAIEKENFESFSDKREKIYSALYHSKQLPILEKALNKINLSEDALFELLREQHYLLAEYSITNKLINYRRFFTINGLISLCVEKENVFNHTHQLIIDLVKENVFDGLRLDHIDGLLYPEQYIERLRNAVGPKCYIVAEKILEQNELLDERWKLQGTTGYDFLGWTNKLLTCHKGAEQLKNYYDQKVTMFPDYEKLIVNNKKQFLEQFMNGELENVVKLFFDLKLSDTYDEFIVKKTLTAFMAALPVYRVYPTNQPLPPDQLEAVKKACKKAVEEDASIIDCMNFIEDLFSHATNQKTIHFLNRIMQISGPLAAKGIEDTSFYNYNALISHNEVGDSPEALSTGLNNFNHFISERCKKFPYSMNATSTHDTKRGEDARMRLNVLTEMPERWISMVEEWSTINQSHKQNNIPEWNDEYFLYQSLTGGFINSENNVNVEKERIKACFIKALREGKRNSTWDEPNEEYEKACLDFIDKILNDDASFLHSLKNFITALDKYAEMLSIVQSALKICCPGVPDIYQGSEDFNYSYVDPDNRRPVNYGLFDQKITNPNSKREISKIYTINKLLHLRKKHVDLFLNGSYKPLATYNPHCMAFMREYNNEILLVVARINATHSFDKEVVVQIPSIKKIHEVLNDRSINEAVFDLNAAPIYVAIGFN